VLIHCPTRRTHNHWLRHHLSRSPLSSSLLPGHQSKPTPRNLGLQHPIQARTGVARSGLKVTGCALDFLFKFPAPRTWTCKLEDQCVLRMRNNLGMSLYQDTPILLISWPPCLPSRYGSNPTIFSSRSLQILLSTSSKCCVHYRNKWKQCIFSLLSSKLNSSTFHKPIHARTTTYQQP
jgi:hypothetical protein